MKLPVAIARMLARFDRMSMRERVLVAGASLVGLVMLWVVAFFDPASTRQRQLNAELETLQQSIRLTTQSMQEMAATDPSVMARKQEEQLTQQLAAINAKLASTSAGLIPPERMVQVIQDVLARQRGVALISLHNRPVTTLAPAATGPAATNSSAAGASASAGPYVHPVEIVVEGSYLDVLGYLHALENLEWRFYWRLLELETTAYPVNRVRIELITLSLDKDWIGV
jgi:MSHA biogenesis protein MshJ